MIARASGHPPSAAGPSGALAEGFAAAYRERYGYPPPPRPLELVSLRVVASSKASSAEAPVVGHAAPAVPVGRQSAWFDGSWHRVPVFDRDRLVSGHRFAGPCLVVEDHSTTVVEARWDGQVDGAGALRLWRGTAEETA